MMDRACGMLLATAFVSSLTASAVAADLDPVPDTTTTTYGWYIRGDVGVALTDVDDQPNTAEGFALGGGIGYRLSDMFRIDATFDGAFDIDFDNTFGTNIDTVTVLGNIYVDLPVSFIFQPYVGAGIGWGQVNGGAFDHEDGVALAGMAGVSYALPYNGALDIGYKARYIDIDNAVADYWLDHSFRIGLRFGF